MWYDGWVCKVMFMVLDVVVVDLFFLIPSAEVENEMDALVQLMESCCCTTDQIIHS